MCQHWEKYSHSLMYIIWIQTTSIYKYVWMAFFLSQITKDDFLSHLQSLLWRVVRVIAGPHSSGQLAHNLANDVGKGRLWVFLTLGSGCISDRAVPPAAPGGQVSLGGALDIGGACPGETWTAQWERLCSRLKYPQRAVAGRYWTYSFIIWDPHANRWFITLKETEM